MTAFVLAVGLVIGLAVGMLGGGGSLLLVPALIYGAHQPPRAAIATSLLVIAVTSVVALVVQARSAQVVWRTGLLFGTAGTLSGHLAGRLSGSVPTSWLLAGFSVMMVASGVAMLRPRHEEAASVGAMTVPGALGVGALVGALAGLVGAGGGFLIVPALVAVGGLPMRKAIATSLFVLAMQSAGSFAGHVTHVTLDRSLVAVLLAATCTASVVGVLLARRIPTSSLREAFGIGVLGTGAFVVVRQLPLSATVGWFLVALTVALGGGLARALRRRV